VERAVITTIIGLAMAPSVVFPTGGDARPGVLLSPFKDEKGGRHGSAGEVVQFVELDADRSDFTIEYNDSLFAEVSFAWLVPLDSVFTPAYLYALLAKSDPIHSRDPAEEDAYRLQLAERAGRLFASHAYAECFAVFGCRATYALESGETEGKTSWPKSLACLDRYLAQFPQGRQHDELEWLYVQLKNAVYEFEGCASGAIEQARAFNAYLESNPSQTFRPEIELRVARLYCQIYEMLTAPDDADGRRGSSGKDARFYSQKACELYETLILSPDPGVAARAEVGLYNLVHGRRIYRDPTDW
jgi:hypothetical protein